MIRKRIACMMLLIIVISSNVIAADMSHVKGQDWLLMNQEEKVTYIFTAIQVLEAQHVPFARSPNDYIEAIDDKLIDSPELVTADVANILASLVYETEPEARSILSTLSK